MIEEKLQNISQEVDDQTQEVDDQSADDQTEQKIKGEMVSVLDLKQGDFINYMGHIYEVKFVGYNPNQRILGSGKSGRSLKSPFILNMVHIKSKKEITIEGLINDLPKERKKVMFEKVDIKKIEYQIMGEETEGFKVINQITGEELIIPKDTKDYEMLLLLEKGVKIKCFFDEEGRFIDFALA